MAYTKQRTQGFEYRQNRYGSYCVDGKDYFLNPGETFQIGDMTELNNLFRVIKASPGSANKLGVITASVTLADNPVGSRKVTRIGDLFGNRYEVSFTNYRDAAVTSGTLNSMVDSTLAGAGKDYTGAAAYIYTGPGTGTEFTVASYTNATGTFVPDIPFKVAPTSASRYIVLGLGSTAGDVINVGSLGVNISADAQTADVGATVVNQPGPLAVESINFGKGTLLVYIWRHRQLGPIA